MAHRWGLNFRRPPTRETLAVISLASVKEQAGCLGLPTLLALTVSQQPRPHPTQKQPERRSVGQMV